MAFLLFPAFLLGSACNFSGSGGSGTSPSASQPTCPSVPISPQLSSHMIPSSSFASASISTAGDDLGAVDDAQDFPITLALALNYEDELSQVLADLYRPGSPTYHRFLSASEFRARYAPTDDQIAKTKAALETAGFRAVTSDENHLLIHATGSAVVISQVLQTELHQYIAVDGSITRAPAYEIQIPDELGVRAVHGLQSFTKLKSHAELPSETPASTSSTFSGPNGGLSPSDVRTAYNIQSLTSAGVDGSGQILGLFELDGYNPSDISAYESYFKIPQITLQNILVDGASGSAGSGADEVTLDIELMTAVAPGAAKIIVYEGPNSEQGVLDTYNRIASDNIAKSISTSWGENESQSGPSFMQTENTIFMQMAAQGQTMFAASGDSGAIASGKTLGVGDPASQPYVTGVGGTQLFMSGGAYNHETTWNSGSASGGAGGGGISSVWSQPTWQSGSTGAQTLGSSAMRNVPDVALHANSNRGYSIYTKGSWTIYGGTSCAAPIWAAFTALVNQERAVNGLGTLGFANPLIYQIGESVRYGADFFDIKDGSTNLYYPAVTGRDDATGWGSFNAANLLSDLAVEPQAVVIPPAQSCPT